jgi:hypothetical protein
MNNKREICTSYKCLIKTCSRHRCNVPKWYKNPLVWLDLEKDCDMFISPTNWKNMEKKDESD